MKSDRRVPILGIYFDSKDFPGSISLLLVYREGFRNGIPRDKRFIHVFSQFFINKDEKLEKLPDGCWYYRYETNPTTLRRAIAEGWPTIEDLKSSERMVVFLDEQAEDAIRLVELLQVTKFLEGLRRF